jgi:Ca2+-binding RTX toxin-like protein
MSALVLASGVALALSKIGTNGPDTLRGPTATTNDLLGRGGNDNLSSLDGTDNLAGGTGKDVLWGGTKRSTGVGDKNLAGGSGNDVVLGGAAPTASWVVQATTSSTAVPTPIT